MGAGRKTQTFIFNERATSSSVNTDMVTPFRLLRKADLGGVIFGCKNLTITECLSKQLFGLPAQHLSYVKNIEAGLPLFLFNYSDRKLHGVYEAASNGQMNIDPYGWTMDGSERTQFPAQVRIRVKTQCQALTEGQFKPVISDNFFSQNHFWFELDHAQVECLLMLFVSRPGKVFLPQIPPNRSNHLNGFLTTSGSSITSSSNEWLPVNKHESWDQDDVLASKEGNTNKPSSSLVENGDCYLPLQRRNWSNSEPVHLNIVSSGVRLEEERETMKSCSNKEEFKSEEDSVLDKLKQLAVNRGDSYSNNSSKQRSDHIAGPDLTGECQQGDEQFQEAQRVLTVESESTMSSVPLPDMAQLRQNMEELKTFVQQQLQCNKVMEKKLVEADREIKKLKDRLREMDLKFGSQGDCMINETSNSSLNEQDFNSSEDCIFLMGGYNGYSWLSALDSYSPSKDLVKSLKPMSTVRSYASATEMNGDIYVFGGGNGASWYDTVECYQPQNNQWISCPPLIQKKGSLAGASLDNKIFAIGGGNGSDSFSDVEMFDPILGRWIAIHSMLEKRFAPAAAQLNGVLYAVGGFNGREYLKSAERFDPREPSWTKLQNMKESRGSHSVAVLDGKLYALGGYDGSEMVSSVEVFDPRTGSWAIGDSMNNGRGYAAVAVLGDALYMIGGVKDGKNIVDTVECYKEGNGWEVTESKAIGKRCFCAAIVL